MKGMKGMKLAETDLILSNEIINEYHPEISEIYMILAILETYYGRISNNSIQKTYNLNKITLKDIAKIIQNNKWYKNYNSLLGFCFERFVYDSLVSNYSEISNWMYDTLCKLSPIGRGSESFEVVLWGTEKGNEISNSILNERLSIIDSDDWIKYNNGIYFFKPLLSSLVHTNSGKFKNLAKADLFVKLSNSKEWFGVNVKLNIEDLKMEKNLNLPIGIALKTNNLSRYKKMQTNNSNSLIIGEDDLIFVYPKTENFGEKLLHYFNYINLFFEEITRDNTKQIKNFYSWPNSIINLIDYIDEPIINLIKYFASQLKNEGFIPSMYIIEGTGIIFLSNENNLSIINSDDSSNNLEENLLDNLIIT
jgi:hypothetical protein